MLTRAKVCYNLIKTPYTYKVDYEGQTITYHFSSELYKDKFISRIKENRINITYSLSNRFGFHVNSDIIADLRLYSSIEKRGYLISVDGEHIECQNDIILDGLKLITKS